MSIVFTGDDNVSLNGGTGSYQPSISMGCWIKTPDPAPAAGDYIALSLGDNIDTSYLAIGYRITGGGVIQMLVKIKEDGVTDELTFDDGYSAGDWTHIATGYTGPEGTLDLIVNGVGVSTLTTRGVAWDGIENVQIGALLTGSFSNYFQGTIAEAAVWNRFHSVEVFQSLCPVSLGLVAFSPLFYMNLDMIYYCPLWSDNAGRVLFGLRDNSDAVPTDSADNYPCIYPSWLFDANGVAGGMAALQVTIKDTDDNTLLGPLNLLTGSTQRFDLGLKTVKGKGIKIVPVGFGGTVNIKYHKRKG